MSLCQEGHSPIFKAIVSLWTQKSNLKCNDLLLQNCFRPFLRYDRALALQVELLLGRLASLTEKLLRALHPALIRWYHLQGKTESSSSSGQPGPGSTQGDRGLQTRGRNGIHGRQLLGPAQKTERASFQ